jgi:hypothetical protein
MPSVACRADEVGDVAPPPPLDLQVLQEQQREALISSLTRE